MNRKVLGSGLAVVLPIIAILILNIGRNPHAIESPLVGKPAPPFALPPVGGGAPVTLAGLRGKPVVLNFWATWCGPCYQEHPVLVAGARRLGDDIQFLGVVYDDDEANVREYLRRQGSSYPNLLDPGGQTAIAYGVYGVPETYFIDGAGTIVAKYVGPLDGQTLMAHLEKARQPPAARVGDAAVGVPRSAAGQASAPSPGDGQEDGRDAERPAAGESQPEADSGRVGEARESRP